MCNVHTRTQNGQNQRTQKDFFLGLETEIISLSTRHLLSFSSLYFYVSFSFSQLYFSLSLYLSISLSFFRSLFSTCSRCFGAAAAVYVSLLYSPASPAASARRHLPHTQQLNHTLISSHFISVAICIYFARLHNICTTFSRVFYSLACFLRVFYSLTCFSVRLTYCLNTHSRHQVQIGPWLDR